ncbi:50S ribosomal protein L14 [bacterium (Candidatus Gribaldobacteria) CG_4_10_14_0_2_um_filter_41_16]|uniref:Large ribosomal subunit protein uL14 n=4 Tax=Candidatus Gribaldobacteria TaxID=2798536 RepID=A0A2M7VIH4_9BACT|nr:MAG: 50S ribosomal protein L14 [Parcubacteria group bacterium CG1_02_41_26]PIR91829.1 MAG: 50S ribosomal protein L14 [bacterium (Candidatus Gribaldobacteria) CG10_big_fil_rev_8_21_14_0_10_41_12]PIV46974.1 MAG: 50S ribosomal protein L14 [bacterium (Candidatus Gribaldobacteria) CG02_land_8_20_14_3_00_41_15]PIX03427.1 MAG: 50S ribosomal protein L14 [bacterium (Candidatus Gribaldobacteria) CG_4_8_14_3_um_filter_42_11]PJA01630.1 MAG: 50S ribosomal protein L14 [bacterium (Candidatus Gribaldobacter
MIQTKTKLNVADNTGAKMVQCIGVPGGTRKRYAHLGQIIRVVVKVAAPRREVKKHQVLKAVIVRQHKPFRRADGSFLIFDDNACCLLNDNNLPKGNRILGPVPRELKEMGFETIITMAKDVI